MPLARTRAPGELAVVCCDSVSNRLWTLAARPSMTASFGGFGQTRFQRLENQVEQAAGDVLCEFECSVPRTHRYINRRARPAIARSRADEPSECASKISCISCCSVSDNLLARSWNSEKAV